MTSGPNDTRYAAALRTWRRTQRMTRDDLALDAGVSSRLIAMLETGRCLPDRDTALMLAACLNIPPRDQNHMLVAAGHDPEFQERRFGKPDFSLIRGEIETFLAAQEPAPALVIDRQWSIRASNRAADFLFAGAEPALLRKPANLLRLCLHPAGIGSRIVNLTAWRTHLIARVRRQICATGDLDLADLLDEVRDYPSRGPHVRPPEWCELETFAVPLKLATHDGELSFIGTTTVFRGATDITLAEITVEAFLPGDAFTRDTLRKRVAPAVASPAL